MVNNSGRLFLGIMTNSGLWGAIISTLVITFLGFILYKKKVLNDHSSNSIQKIVISIIIPFLSFYSFLTNADSKDIKTIGIVFGLSAIYYFLLTTIAIIWVKYLPHAIPKRVLQKAEAEFAEYQLKLELNQRQIFSLGNYFGSLQKKHLVTWLMCIYGSNILFATPIVIGVFPNGIELGSLSIWNTLYYIGGFGLSFSLLAGTKFSKEEFKHTFKKAFLNPAFIAIIVAITLWATQYIPKAGVYIEDITPFSAKILKDGKESTVFFSLKGTYGPNFSELYGLKIVDPISNKEVIQWFVYEKLHAIYVPYLNNPTGWFDWKITMPYIAKPITILVSLISPLIWMVIGTSLAKTNLKEMFIKKENWLFLIYKSILIPIFILCLVIPFVKSKLLSANVGSVLVMTGAVPPGTSIVLYSQHLKVHEKYTSQVSSLSTITSFVFIPLWLVIGIVTLNIV
ncbi:AEC family transporter [Metamycoplasma equirhinis]|uniref:AEC family transporter n=1 Tax=Metamycoplasma equirhinis TaxID=92402 RepID=UPI0035943123